MFQFDKNYIELRFFFLFLSQWDSTIGQWSYIRSSQLYDSDENDSSEESYSGNSDCEAMCKPRRSQRLKAKKRRQLREDSMLSRKLFD